MTFPLPPLLPSNTFQVDCRNMGGDNYLHFINIEDITPELETLIDNSIVSICEGNTNTSLPIIKKRLITFLQPKKGTTIEQGAIAEFFAHLYLNEIGFRQECLFLNLEEGSIKKGFDGYYSLGLEEWIYESKSGVSSTIGINHKDKIGEAYRDLKNKISNSQGNDPWRNAYMHASQIDVGTDATIRKNLKQLSEGFVNNVSYDIGNFNIIPGSTIFLEGNWEPIDGDDLGLKITQLLSNYDFKKINVICTNKKSLDLFWTYLNK